MYNGRSFCVSHVHRLHHPWHVRCASPSASMPPRSLAATCDARDSSSTTSRRHRTHTIFVGVADDGRRAGMMRWLGWPAKHAQNGSVNTSVEPKEAPSGGSLMPDSTRDATWIAWNKDEHDDQVRRLLTPTSEHCGAATALGLTPTVSVSNHACVWALTILDEKSGMRVPAHVAVYAIDDESATSAAEIIGDTALRSTVRKSLPDVGEVDDRFPPKTY
jgi:hypothetical protein